MLQGHQCSVLNVRVTLNGCSKSTGIKSQFYLLALDIHFLPVSRSGTNKFGKLSKFNNMTYFVFGQFYLYVVNGVLIVSFVVYITLNTHEKYSPCNGPTCTVKLHYMDNVLLYSVMTKIQYSISADLIEDTIGNDQSDILFKQFGSCFFWHCKLSIVYVHCREEKMRLRENRVEKLLKMVTVILVSKVPQNKFYLFPKIQVHQYLFTTLGNILLSNN